jgi:hypothetical protein
LFPFFSLSLLFARGKRNQRRTKKSPKGCKTLKKTKGRQKERNSSSSHFFLLFVFFFQRLFPVGFVLLWRKEGKRKVALFLPLEEKVPKGTVVVISFSQRETKK